MKTAEGRGLKAGLGLRLKATGAIAASLAMVAALGCAPATGGSSGADGAPVDAADETQGVALAFEYSDGSDMFKHKAVEVTDASLVGEGAQFINGVDAENTYIYKGYAHGDNNHYSMYSLYTELITDGDGLLTAINLTSAADTWANKWGAAGARPTIAGMLPEGVSFELEETQEGDDAVLTWDLAVEEGTEAAEAGSVLNQIYLYNVQDDLTTVGSDTVGRGGRTTHNSYDVLIDVAAIEGEADDDDDDDAPASADGGRGEGHGGAGAAHAQDGGQGEGGESSAGYAFDPKTNTLTIVDGAYNLVQVRYQFGTEVFFDQYIPVAGNESAQAYVDANVEEADLSAPEEIDDMAVTNRNKWTYSMLSLIAQRELSSWGATFEDESLYTGGNDSEIGDIDTISGATKTSVPFQSALNQAIEAGYVTGVADTVQVTIDGGDPASGGIDVSAVQQDQTSVTKDADGNYVVTMNFPAGVDESANGDLTHAISPSSVKIYALGDQNLGTLGVWNLGKGTAGFEPVATYADSSKEPGDVADDHVIYVSDWEYPYMPQLTVVDPSITHVVVSYAIGHETLGIAYDLAAMAQANEVQTMIEALDASDAQAVAAARQAYDALSHDVKGTVGNYQKLLDAESE